MLVSMTRMAEQTKRILAIIHSKTIKYRQKKDQLIARVSSSTESVDSSPQNTRNNTGKDLFFKLTQKQIDLTRS